MTNALTCYFDYTPERLSSTIDKTNVWKQVFTGKEQKYINRLLLECEYLENEENYDELSVTPDEYAINEYIESWSDGDDCDGDPLLVISILLWTNQLFLEDITL